MRRLQRLLLALTLIVTSGCATLPTGPSVTVLPSPGKPFDQFKREDAECRRWAEQQVGLSPQEIADKNAATGALVGTGIGAGLGALIGSTSGNAGVGAAIGGLSGLLIGSASGTDEGRRYGRDAQQRYDSAYLQCMYSYGNQIMGPVRGGFHRRVIVVPPEDDYYYLPPPSR